MCRGAAPLGSPVSGGGGRREDKPSLSEASFISLSVNLIYLCVSVVNFFPFLSPFFVYSLNQLIDNLFA